MSEHKIKLLMRENEPVLSFSTYKYYFDEVVEIINPSLLPIGVGRKAEHFETWFGSRLIPHSRIDFLRNFSDAQVNNNSQLAMLTCGLSLLNQYWIKDVDEDLNWSYINSFSNTFSEQIGKALFNKESLKEELLPLHRFSPEAMSPGELQKRWTCSGDERYLVKKCFSPENAANEMLASFLADEIGLQHAQYDIEITDKGVCVVSKCFTDKDTEIVSLFDLTLEYGIPAGTSSKSHFQTICEYIGKLGITDAASYLQKLLTIDYIMGQTDRHYNNIALLHNIRTDSYAMAPLFDSERTFFAGIPEQFISGDESVMGKPFGPNGMIDLNEQVMNVTSVELSKEALDRAIDKYSQVLISVGVTEDRIKFLSELINKRYLKMCNLINK